MRRLAIAPLLVAAAACGTPAGPPAAVGDTAVQPASGVKTVPATAPPVAPPATTAPAVPAARPTTAAPKPAPPAARPKATTPPAAKPAARPAGSGDVDGDGRADAIRITERADSLATGSWPFDVVLAGGRGTVTGVLQADPQVRPALLGVRDADRDGDGEAFFRVGGGASTTAYVAFALVEDGMAEVRTPDGKALRLLAGGSVTHGDGFACADVDQTAGRELVALSVVSDDGTTFRGTRRTYRWRSDRVELLSTRSFSGRQGDPAVRASYEVDCDGL